MYFQDVILNLQKFWAKQGCILSQPHDIEKGAGTFSPNTFLRSLGPEPFNSAYVEPCRRPTDGRYGDNPIRMQHYYQFQVILKPNPDNIVDLYLESLKSIGILPQEHDIRFVHDDWETAALGAWGLGWEVWCDGTEVTQFTYFQQVGGIELSPISGEITYGLERLTMFLQDVDNVFDLQYNADLKYGDIFKQNEIQFSKYNFELADSNLHRRWFQEFSQECQSLCDQNLSIPALDYAMKASHCLNLLDARNAISTSERQGYILNVRNLSQKIALAWVNNRQQLNFPLGQFTTPETIVATPFIPSISTIQTVPFLIELGVEEMPAKVFSNLFDNLQFLWDKLVTPLELNVKNIRFWATPRRIAIIGDSIDTQQVSKEIELKGPPSHLAKDEHGQWTAAALGFAKKNDISVQDLQTKFFGKSEYLVAQFTQKGQLAVKLLSEVLPTLFSKIHWYKTMKWGVHQVPFVRPIQWVVALVGNGVIPFGFAGKSSSNQSYGHRFLSSAKIEVTPENYQSELKKNFVIVDPQERKRLIKSQIQELIKKHNLVWKVDEDLLNEVNYLVEYPFPILGSFSQKFLSLPAELIVTETKYHQKYFSLYQTQWQNFVFFYCDFK